MFGKFEMSVITTNNSFSQTSCTVISNVLQDIILNEMEEGDGSTWVDGLCCFE